MQNQKIRTENQNSNGKHEKKTERSGEKIEEEERRQMNDALITHLAFTVFAPPCKASTHQRKTVW